MKAPESSCCDSERETHFGSRRYRRHAHYCLIGPASGVIDPSEDLCIVFVNSLGKLGVGFNLFVLPEPGNVARLSDFLAANPEWDVRIDAAPYPTDFDREVMDLDIRYGLGKWTGFHSMPVTSDFVLPLCSPEYRDALMSKTADPRGALRSAKLIDSARALCQWDYWLMRNGISDVANHKSILIDRSSMAIQLALDGVGVVLESLTLAAKEVYSGALVPLMPSIGVIAFPAYWMVCPNRYVSRRAVGIFMAWLMESAKTHEREVLDFLQANGLALDKIDGPSELATSNVHSP